MSYARNAAAFGVGSGSMNQAPTDDTLTLVANGKALTGWETIRVTRGIERVPSDFEISMTTKYPGSADVVVKPGDTCQVKIGNDLVVTGYVDSYEPAISAQQHAIRVVGRSKCQDLVDNSAGINAAGKSNGMQVTTSSLLDLAKQFAAPFGITASVVGGYGPGIDGGNSPVDISLVLSNGQPLNFNITLTETPMQIIEECARYAALLTYDGTDGNLLFAPVGASKMASGFQQGVNIQSAVVCFSMADRHSIYVPSLTSQDTLSDLPGTIFPSNPVYDRGVTRFRPLIVVSEQFVQGGSLAEKRATWEMNRRIGRSQSVRLTCDSWRDSAGTLWQPNATARVDIPALGVVAKDWVIATVSFMRGLESGTTAELILMPAAAFTLEPSTLQPYDWQVYEYLHPQSDGFGSNSDLNTKQPANVGNRPPGFFE